MFAKSLLFVFVVVGATADRLDNTYLPPSSATGSAGNGDILEAPYGSPSAAGGGQATNLNAIGESPTTGADNQEAGAAILKFENDNDGNGNYKFAYETENGISHSETGELKNAGDEDTEAMSVQGSYSYMGPDGVMYTVTYVADENGFRATGDHLPTAPPVPEAIQTALDKIAEMAAADSVGNDAAKEQQQAQTGNAETSADDEHKASYQREHNHDTQAVVIEAEPPYQPPQTASRQYLAPNKAHFNEPADGYRY